MACVHFEFFKKQRPSEIGVVDKPINMEEGPTEVPEDEDEEIIEEEIIEEEIIETVHRRISMEDPPTERYNPDDEPEEDIEHVQDQGAVTSKVSNFLQCQVLCFCCFCCCVD
jgi:hypothetical protein